MKKPTKTPKLIEQETYEYIEYDVLISPDYLISMANRMKENNIEFIKIQTISWNEPPDIHIYKYETPDQVEKRYSKELKDYNKFLDKQAKLKEKNKANILREAKKLGLKIDES